MATCLVFPALLGTLVTTGVAAAAERCGAQLEHWLYDSAEWAPPGYHVLCVSGDNQQTLELYRGGHGSDSVRWQAKITSLSSFRKDLEKKAQMQRQDMWKVLPWLLADTSGQPVKAISDITGPAVLLLFEGGRWVWPGIREGFERVVRLPSSGQATNVTLKTLTLDPLSFTIEEFFDRPAAQRMIEIAKPKLRPAEILTQDSHKENRGDLGEEVRTCWETWLSPNDGPDLEAVAQRSAALVRVPRELQADFRVLRYHVGQHFGAHTDYYEPEDFQEQPEVLNELQNGRNWLVTVYLYLSTVSKGGATYFPSSYGKPLPTDVLKCEGPAVKPKRGRALMFYSLHPNGQPNLSSMHGACKVEKGVKYTINIWTFNQQKPTSPKVKQGKGQKKISQEL